MVKISNLNKTEENITTIIEIATGIILEITEENMGKLSKSEMAKFEEEKRLVKLELLNFITEYRLELTSLVFGLVIMDQLIDKKVFDLDSLNNTRYAMIISLMLGTKYHEDLPISVRDFANYFNLPIKKFAEHERKAYFYLGGDFLALNNLFVTYENAIMTRFMKLSEKN